MLHAKKGTKEPKKKKKPAKILDVMYKKKGNL